MPLPHFTLAYDQLLQTYGSQKWPDRGIGSLSDSGMTASTKSLQEYRGFGKGRQEIYRSGGSTSLLNSWRRAASISIGR